MNTSSTFASSLRSAHSGVPKGTFCAPTDPGTSQNTDPGNHSDEAQIERKKDRFDLKPAIAFVELHRVQYENAIAQLTARPPADEAHSLNPKYISPLKFNSAGPQVSPTEIKSFLRTLPVSFLQLSKLTTVDYSGADMVPVPLFDDEGNWNYSIEGGKVDIGLIDISDFVYDLVGTYDIPTWEEVKTKFKFGSKICE